jgi:uncharacterized protein (DUF305 family)
MDAGPKQLSDLSFDQLMELQRRADSKAAAGEGGGDDDGGEEGGDDGGGEGGEVVLPWWQHPINILTMLVTSLLIAGMIGWMIGDNGGRPAHNEVDTGFLQDMRLHHEQALDISRAYLAADDTEGGLAVIASSIIQGQTLEVGRMVQMLRFFGEPEANEGTTSMAWMGMSTEVGMMPGMASEDDIDRLATLSGRQADELFAALMIEHHQGGVHMAEYAAEHGASPEVRALAESIVQAQQGEIAEIAGRFD